MRRSTSFCLAAIAVPVLVPVLMIAQTSTTRRSDGSEVDFSKSDSVSQRVVKIPSVNGSLVAKEKIEERVISKDANGAVIERYVTHYDQNGNPTGRDRVRIEERLQPGGGSTTTTTTYRSDINGNMSLSERATAEKRKNGDNVTTTSSVERPSVNGSLETVERRESSATKSGDTTREDSTVYRRDVSGNFTPTLRETVERTEKNGNVSENTTQYRPGATGSMQLTDQIVSKTATAQDGSTTQETNLYQNVVPGRVSDPFNTRPVLREQQLIEVKPGPGGTTVETIGVRRPSLADPNRVAGPFQTIEESVCTGKCNSVDKPPSAKDKP